MDQALRFLIDTVFGLFTYSFLARFMMQALRAPFRNPVGPAVMALTDWAVKPTRRIVPGLRGVDWATVILAWIAQWLWLMLLGALAARALAAALVPFFALLAMVELLKAAIWILIIAVFLQAILSWIAPDGPLSGLLNALTFRFLAPIRRTIPPLGGTLDLSPLVFIVVAQLILMLPVRWLEALIVQVFSPGFVL
ncbi:MAG TPA: YggT family protein [Casimicrobiaceae bacterium]|nr:YggT family protein [Casimicrobiaceae bacterium]